MQFTVENEQAIAALVQMLASPALDDFTCWQVASRTVEEEDLSDKVVQVVCSFYKMIEAQKSDRHIKN